MRRIARVVVLGRVCPHFVGDTGTVRESGTLLGPFSTKYMTEGVPGSRSMQSPRGLPEAGPAWLKAVKLDRSAGSRDPRTSATFAFNAGSPIAAPQFTSTLIGLTCVRCDRLGKEDPSSRSNTQ